MVNFSLVCFTGCLILVLGRMSLTRSQQDQNQRDAPPFTRLYFDNGYEINLENMGLATRAITQVAKGHTAVQNLLRGAKRQGARSKKFLKYHKNGNYETALRDFNSVHPNLDMINPNMHYPTDRLIGSVGHIRLILLKNGDSYNRGAPVLEIRSAVNEVYHKIVYKMPNIQIPKIKK